MVLGLIQTPFQPSINSDQLFNCIDLYHHENKTLLRTLPNSHMKGNYFPSFNPNCLKYAAAIQP